MTRQWLITILSFILQGNEEASSMVAPGIADVERKEFISRITVSHSMPPVNSIWLLLLFFFFVLNQR